MSEKMEHDPNLLKACKGFENEIYRLIIEDQAPIHIIMGAMLIALSNISISTCDEQKGLPALHDCLDQVYKDIMGSLNASV